MMPYRTESVHFFVLMNQQLRESGLPKPWQGRSLWGFNSILVVSLDPSGVEAGQLHPANPELRNLLLRAEPQVIEPRSTLMQSTLQTLFFAPLNPKP